MERAKKFRAKMVAAGHTPILNEDDRTLNIFVTSHSGHNGPGCSTCGWTVCWHCFGDDNPIPPCAEVAASTQNHEAA